MLSFSACLEVILIPCPISTFRRVTCPGTCIASTSPYFRCDLCYSRLSWLRQFSILVITPFPCICIAVNKPSNFLESHFSTQFNPLIRPINIPTRANPLFVLVQKTPEPLSYLGIRFYRLSFCTSWFFQMANHVLYMLWVIKTHPLIHQ